MFTVYSFPIERVIEWCVEAKDERHVSVVTTLLHPMNLFLTQHTHTVLRLQIVVHLYVDILTVVFLSSAVVIATADAYFWKPLETCILFFSPPI